MKTKATNSLTYRDKEDLENLLGMESGYVLGFYNASFANLFEKFKVDIYSPKYCTHGDSKAKRLRAFWNLESNQLVGQVLSRMLLHYEVHCDQRGIDIDIGRLQRVQASINRMTSQPVGRNLSPEETEFLNREFTNPNTHKLPISPQVASVIELRLKEVELALSSGAYLSVIFLCGSILEAVLFGAAEKSIELFNRAKASPKKKDGSPKALREWTLAYLINVACEVGILKPDIKGFSHGLRDFRNYIHPREQVKSNFTPDEHTAEVCFQVLRAALVNLAGER